MRIIKLGQCPAHQRADLFDFENGRTNFTYDRVNNPLTATDAERNTASRAYDDLNRLIAVTNAENETERYRYDKMGNRTHLIMADGTVTLYGHDDIYRLDSVTENHRDGMTPNNDTNVLTRYQYDARGLRTRFVNANNPGVGVPTNARKIAFGSSVFSMAVSIATMRMTITRFGWFGVKSYRT